MPKKRTNKNKAKGAKPQSSSYVLKSLNGLNGSVPANGTGEDVSNIHLKEEKPDPLQLFCICRAPDDGLRSMIQCDHCADWFHFDCVGINPVLLSLPLVLGHGT